MNDPRTSSSDPTAAEPVADQETAASQERAEAHGERPIVDLRTGDPSPSGANPDGEASAEGAPDEAGEEGDQLTTGVDLESLADADPRSKAKLMGALLDLEADRDQYLDDLRRARAEFENYRRRVTREAASQRKAGTADAVGALLEVLDDLDRTLDAAGASSDEALSKGVELVASKLASALRDLGLERIDEVGGPFDPTQHEAVQQMPADETTEEPVVAEVLRPGYRLGEQVLRPAMVVVRG